MDERDKKTELLVGLFLTVGLLFLSLLILQFSTVRELFKDTYTLTVPFPDGSGLRENTPVLFGGLRIGKVSRMPVHDATYTGIIVTIEIYQKEKIPVDAKFSIGTAGLLGDTFIEIRSGSADTRTYYQDGAVVAKERVAQAGGLGALQDTAKDLSNKLETALNDLRGAVGDVRASLKKLNEGALSDESVKDVKGTLAQLNSVVTRLNEKIFSEQTSTEVKEAVAAFRETARTLEATAKKLEPALAKADHVMVSADKAMKTMDTSAAAIGRVATDLRKGDGLLPALLHDQTLKSDFTSFMANLRERGVLWYRDNDSEKPHAPSLKAKP
ncbi:MAG: MlaD family protein [Roseimicrobium sp.]